MPRTGTKAPKLRPPALPSVAAGLPGDDGGLLAHCTAGWKAWCANGDLVKLLPANMTVGADLAALRTAVNAAPGGGPPETAAVTAAAKNVRADWHLLAKFLEGYLRKGNVVDAAALALSVLMRLSNVGRRPPKPPLAVKRSTSGTVVVSILAVLDAVLYAVEWSTDEQNWSSATSHKTRLTITGLTPGKRYWFRVKAYLRNDTWTDPIATVDLIVV